MTTPPDDFEEQVDLLFENIAARERELALSEENQQLKSKVGQLEKQVPNYQKPGEEKLSPTEEKWLKIFSVVLTAGILTGIGYFFYRASVQPPYHQATRPPEVHHEGNYDRERDELEATICLNSQTKLQHAECILKEAEEFDTEYRERCVESQSYCSYGPNERFMRNTYYQRALNLLEGEDDRLVREISKEVVAQSSNPGYKTNPHAFPYSDYIKVHLLQAKMWEKMGQREEALGNCYTVLEFDPQNKAAKAMLERLEDEGSGG